MKGDKKMHQLKNNRKILNKGFTLVELLVSIAIFSMVFVSASGAFVSVLDAYQKITKTRVSVDNLTNALESLVREAKTGTNYHCGSTLPLTTPLDCASGDTYFAFVNTNVPRILSGGSQTPSIVYKFVACPSAFPYCGRIQRSDDGGVNFFPVTVAPPDLMITDLKFIAIGSTPFSDATLNVVQPQVTIVIRGYVTLKGGVTAPFSVQTTASQRNLDIL